MTLDLLASEPHYLAHLSPLAGHADVTVVVPEPSSSRAIAHFRTLAKATGMGLRTSTRLTGAPVVVASYSDQVLARSLKAERIVVAEHGAGQSYGGNHPSYPGGRGRGDAAMFLVPNHHAAGRWREACPDIPVRIVGSPRLDHLPSRDGSPGPTVAVAFHWQCPVARPWAGTAFPEYRAALAGLAERFHVIGHGHPRAIDGLAPWYAKAGIEVVRDSDEVMRRADVLVADNTSLLFEFAISRPVVVLNSRLWTPDVDLGLRFWAAAGVGIGVDRGSDLAAAVAQALEDPGDVRMAREAALDIVYAHRSGAAARSVEAIREVLGVAA